MLILTGQAPKTILNVVLSLSLTSSYLHKTGGHGRSSGNSFLMQPREMVGHHRGGTRTRGITPAAAATTAATAVAGGGGVPGALHPLAEAE